MNDFENHRKADEAVRSVIEAAHLLHSARMNNDTADFILAEQSKLEWAVSSLLGTLNDIKQANANRRAA